MVARSGLIFKEIETTVGTDALDEQTFMDSILNELHTGLRQPLVVFTDEELEALEAERIGEHFCRYPFFY